MEYLVTAEEMRYYDQNTSSVFGIPSLVLMERAALSCRDVILARQKQLADALSGSGMQPGRRVLVLAGTGNNGGDGLALGRLLMQEGFCVDFVLAGAAQKATEQTRQQMATLQAYGAVIRSTLPETEYDIMIDALFGVGLSREVSGFYRECIEYMNQSDAFVVAVDIPSGIHSDSGAVLGAAVCADVTVTFSFRKLGLFLYPGADYAGRVVCAQIGITKESFLQRPPGIFTFTEPVAGLMPPRRRDGNKGTFGKVLLAAGSEGMAGAAILAGRGAFAAGCGMVKLVSPASNRVILQQALPEAMVAEDVREKAGWADVIAAGPGLSQSEAAKETLRWVIEATKQPLILDADAINLLAGHPDLLESLVKKQADPDSRRPLALTPHPGELAGLCGCSTQQVLQAPADKALFWAQKLQGVVLCKGARTFVACSDGRIYVNGSGNSGMATAGSGDVLTGIIASLAAQEEDLFSAVCLGVYLHGLAGDRAAHEKSEYSMKAGDIIEMVSVLLME